MTNCRTSQHEESNGFLEDGKLYEFPVQLIVDDRPGSLADQYRFNVALAARPHADKD